jgi:RNA recognition motif-containing protein
MKLPSRSFFSGCGEISQCDLLYTHAGQSRGIAFVTFASRSSLSAALALSDTDFGGRPIKVSEATGHGKRDTPGKSKGKGKGGKDKGKETSTKSIGFESREFEVFIGGLPYSMSVENIRADFAELGDIGRCHIPLNEDGEHKGLAFINYLMREGMEKALEFNDQEYGGVWIRVQKADAPRTLGKGKSESAT